MSRYGARANSKRNRTKSKKDNSKRDDYLRTQKEIDFASHEGHAAIVLRLSEA